MKSGNRQVLGHEVGFTRRRYGTTTFTWAYVRLGDECVGLGDPVPSVHWRQSELEHAVGCVLKRRGKS